MPRTICVSASAVFSQHLCLPVSIFCLPPRHLCACLNQAGSWNTVILGALQAQQQHLLCCAQDGFAEENAIFGGYNQSAATTSAEQASGNLRLLDNFTLYAQTDAEGSEELVDLQDFSAGWYLVKGNRNCCAVEAGQQAEHLSCYFSPCFQSASPGLTFAMDIFVHMLAIAISSLH